MLAVTDDAFVLEALRWDVVKRYDERRGGDPHDKGPAAATAILNASPDPLDQEVITGAKAAAVTAEAYGTDVLNVVEAGLNSGSPYSRPTTAKRRTPSPRRWE